MHAAALDCAPSDGTCNDYIVFGPEHAALTLVIVLCVLAVVLAAMLLARSRRRRPRGDR